MSQDSKLPSSSGISIRVPIPATDPKLYGRGAVDDILLYLSRHRYDTHSPTDIAGHLEHSESAVRRAIEVLEGNGLVTVERDGNRMLVGVNRERLSVPDDPILRIPQSEFQQPAKTATDRLESELDDVVGVVLYGSVARGDADRRSDIDMWVAVRTDRPENQRRASRLEDDLESERFDGDRYDFHIVVESVESIPSFTDDVREIIQSGIALSGNEEFDTLRKLLTEETTDE